LFGKFATAKERQMSTALFVDTYSRQIEVSTVSVSQVPEKGLVIRYGAKIGNLWQLTNSYGDLFRNHDLPVIVSTGGYNAYSSAGFVEVVEDYRAGNTRGRTQVIGVQGMPFQARKGLSVMSDPMNVLVLRPGTNIAMLETHARRKPGEGWHSNPDAAAAAIQGIKLRAQIRPYSVFIIEGQSDYAQAWELCTEYYEDYQTPFAPEFPDEFRSEVFADEAFVVAAIRRYARKSAKRELERSEMDGKIFMFLNMFVAGASTEGIIPRSTMAMIGNDRVREVCESMANGLRQHGWKLGVDLTLDNRFLQAISPEGEVAASGYALFVVEDIECRGRLIDLLDALTEEEREYVKGREEVILQG
jgi:hypothetical protein